jgi:hypothetical protein
VRKSAAVLLCVLLFTLGVLADDWPAATVQNVFSDNGRYFVRILPGQSIGDSVGFSGRARFERSSRIPPLIVACCSCGRSDSLHLIASQGVSRHMPRRAALASCSARWSSSRRTSGRRTVTRARPSRTSTAFTNTPSSRHK